MDNRKIDKNFFGRYCVYYYNSHKDTWYPYRESFDTREEAEKWLEDKRAEEQRWAEMEKNAVKSGPPDDYYGVKGRYYGD